MKELIDATKALINDIEEMQDRKNPSWFGDFSSYDDAPNNTGHMTIEWPNLAISSQALRDVLTKIENQEEGKAIPPYWHEHNPWKDELIYVPIEELADCALSVTHGRTKEAVLEQWSQYGIWLDAYILTGPTLTAGIRFGPEESEYLSPGFFNSLLFILLEKYKGSKI